MKCTLFILLFPMVLFSQIEICEDELIKVEVEAIGVGNNFIWSSYPMVDIVSYGDEAELLISEIGVYTVELKFEYYGCDYVVYKTFEVIECIEWTIYIANALSPNGTNRTWFPKGENITIESIEIYDRWGHVVWSHNDVEFEGMADSGMELDGQFTYVVLFRDNRNIQRIRTGGVFIIR
jgi:hypothetical protein